jgi:hypothetical protein
MSSDRTLARMLPRIQDARIRALILLGESVDQPDESVSPADAPEIAPITIPRSP